MAEAAALDELVVLCPAGDSAEAEGWPTDLGARWVEVAGPSDVPAAFAEVLGAYRRRPRVVGREPTR